VINKKNNSNEIGHTLILSQGVGVGRLGAGEFRMEGTGSKGEKNLVRGRGGKKGRMMNAKKGTQKSLQHRTEGAQVRKQDLEAEQIIILRKGGTEERGRPLRRRGG